MKVIGDVVKDASPNKYNGEIKEAKWVRASSATLSNLKKAI